MLKKSILSLLLSGALVAPGVAFAQVKTEISFLRFFGGCADEYANVTDVDKASGECGVIQVLTNKFNAENKDGIKVNTQNVDWNAYYDLLSTKLASNEAPDIAVMHRSTLPNFVARDLIESIGEDLTKAGVDLDDFAKPAREAVTYENKTWGLPFDIHALLWHVNVDIMKAAGLVDASGAPIVPKNAQELFEQARIVKEKTGKRYISMDARNDAMPVRVFNMLMWQQGADVFSSETGKPTINTAQGKQALDFIQKLYKDGLAVATHGNGEASQSFQQGEAAIMVNGTWAVNRLASLSAEGKIGFKTYAVADFPPIFGKATWSDSHMWVMPKKNRTPEQKAAAIAFLKYLNDNGISWAKTGHLPVRTSVLQSEAYAKLPFRNAYAQTAQMARAVPMVQNQRPAQDAMRDSFGAALLTDKSTADALAEAQSKVERLFRRVR
ncbi:ABC transporter substrate-binding protein [Microvirga aerilata]|uniref:ABC transporter substrate-binding protein n=1 Tax=Microvirga aerilata TaxID=670292 RepID=A0A937CWR3_9HYPH|nr:ABC transporter substrate-binding protein [Microvirga aerilata]MBL0404098.1 ABC transporter substrate-binding protein [Microvirga aerilata]